MENSIKIYILNEFRTYHRLIQAFNPENFRDHRRIKSNIFNAFCASLTILLIPAVSITVFWRCAENNFDLNILAVTIPLFISSLQVELIFIPLLWKNHVIIDTIE